ncbi:MULTISPECIES: pyrroline-5-carboxylate reductase [Ferrimicrobium]|uniref:Pyrroline-5-carboxylate reductase n=1 Tax=Ferrimicrobium acidiphilum TaxID=121039 RepID=A0ABV3Y8F6_9ACTN|nr:MULTISPECIES: pyrroline-5-carboxylate reductase [Ferrimicrobium]MCL5972874.1 pyrroline-5-carboxylate reductase [Actinomycetota bacterium]
MYDLLVVGAGNMGSALAVGMGNAEGGPKSIAILDHTLNKAQAVAARLPQGRALTELESADVYLLAVKPHHIRNVVKELPAGAKVISVAAGIRLAQLNSWLVKGGAIVRAMPNTACEIGQGVTAVCATAGSEDLAARAQEWFRLVGEVFLVPEKQFDVVSALSGSGPAYVFLLLEAMQEAGITLGLPAAMALDLARATVRGAGLLSQARQDDPRAMRLAVTSPGGMTAEAIAVFEKLRFRHQVLTAVRAAAERSQELSALAED